MCSMHMLFNFKIEALFLPAPKDNASNAQSVHALSSNAWANLDKRSKSRTRHKPAPVIKASPVHSARQQARVVPVVVDNDGRLLVSKQSVDSGSKYANAQIGDDSPPQSALVTPPVPGGKVESSTMPLRAIAEVSIANTEPFGIPLNETNKEDLILKGTHSTPLLEPPRNSASNHVFTNIHDVVSDFPPASPS